MGITFTRAPTVAKGDPITSTQLRKLAAAFNDRLRSGVGDGPWRIVFYWLSMFRQVRNPDETGFLFPALAEFFTAGYQMLGPAGGLPGITGDPAKRESVWPYPAPGLSPEDRGGLDSATVSAEWPVAGPGEPEGANLANQIMAYVFGAEAIDLYDESSRLTNPDAGGINLSPSSTPSEIWELGKQQRGSFDATTGGVGSPAWDAARSHHRIAMGPTSPHGNAYGSYLPTADLSGEACDDPGDGGPPPANYIIKFTPIRPGVPEIPPYAGTCRPTGGNDYPDHVAYIGYASWAYFVYLNDGTIDILLTADYVEGPYSGEARLRKTANGAIPRVLSKFSGEFRGSNTQRAIPGYWLDNAFDVQKFLTTQYHLAPNIGKESAEGIASVYPVFRFDNKTTHPAGSLGRHIQSGSTHHGYNTNCVLTAFLVAASGMTPSSAVTIELKDGTALVKSFTVEADEEGNLEQIVVLDAPVTPASLSVRLASALTFTSLSGRLALELNEILKQKPTYEDLFLVLRAGGCLSGADSTDGNGTEETLAKTIETNYFENACILNAHGALEIPIPDAAVNHNAVFDAARRMSQCIRIIPRQHLVAYAVEGGKSICWFKQRAQIGEVSVTTLDGVSIPTRYREVLDYNGILRASTTHHAYVGSVLSPSSFSPSELLNLGGTAPPTIDGIVKEDGVTLITTETGEIIVKEI